VVGLQTTIRYTECIMVVEDALEGPRPNDVI
jgi:hypothetical protein